MKKFFNEKKEQQSRNNNEHYEYSLGEHEENIKKKYKLKNIGIKRLSKIIGLIFIGFILGIACAPSGYTVEEYNSLENELKQLKTERYELEAQNRKLEGKVELAAPWFEMKEEEQKAQEEKLQAEKEAKAKAEEEKLAAEQKAEEEAKAKEKAEAEAKEKQGYETGITYSQLARTPDDYLLEKVKFQGKVIQVIEGSDITQIRLAVGGNYDNIILGEYTSDIVSSRILEDDYITIYGISAGLITYESTIGGNITIPSIVIDKIGK